MTETIRILEAPLLRSAACRMFFGPHPVPGPIGHLPISPRHNVIEPATAIQCVAELRRIHQARQPGNATAPVRAVKNRFVWVDTRLISHNMTTMRLFIHQNVRKVS